jgi:DNA-binding HxlR family transcriptional regulator
MKEQVISSEDLRETIQSLEESFTLLSQKWNLEILYTLFLKNVINFSQLKRTLRVNSRTLSDKLRSLAEFKYVERRVKTRPPLRVEYVLTTRGKNVVLLALPLLYYLRVCLLSRHDQKKKTSKTDPSYRT